MIALYAAVLTLIVSLLTIVLAIFVSRSRFPKKDAAQSTASVYRTRRIYFLVLAGVVVAALAATLPFTPYPGRYFGPPDVKISAVGAMWYWTLTPNFGAVSANGGLVLPVHKLVEFDVTSQDVNHNFAIYNTSGHLLVQAQAMPNYTNRLFYRFDVPGKYYVICLEYCGIAHHAMNTEFDVR